MSSIVRVLAAALLVAGVSTAASAQTKWDMPVPYPDGNFHTKNAAQFAADVDKATNGALKITVHGAGSLIKHPEIKRAVRQGTAPIGEILESLPRTKRRSTASNVCRSSPPAMTPRRNSTPRRSRILRSSSPPRA